MIGEKDRQPALLGGLHKPDRHRPCECVEVDGIRTLVVEDLPKGRRGLGIAAAVKFP
jgi:hypothetical protein